MIMSNVRAGIGKKQGIVDIESYTQEYANQYARGGFETVLVQVRRQRVLASTEQYNHARILEVGCGLEPLFLHIDRFDAYVVVEPSPQFAENARRLSAGDSRVTVVESMFEDASDDLPQAGHFDFIVVSGLLHWVQDPERLLRSINDVCSESTVVHINVPNVYSFHRLLAHEMGLIADLYESTASDPFHHRTRFDADSLRRILEDCGFRILSSGSYFVKPLTHTQMDRIIEAGIVDSSIVRGLEGMIKYMPKLGCEIYADISRK